MNKIDSTAEKLAQFIKENYEDSKSIEYLRYALIIAINAFVSVFVTLVITLFTGHSIRFLESLSIFIILRYFTGGMHFRSSIVCCIFTIICFVGLVHVQFDYIYIGIVLDIFTFVVFLVRAPQGIDVIRPVSKKTKLIIKVVSLLLVLLNLLFIHSSLLSTVMFVQALSLTRTVENIIKKIEGGITE